MRNPRVVELDLLPLFFGRLLPWVEGKILGRWFLQAKVDQRFPGVECRFEGQVGSGAREESRVVSELDMARILNMTHASLDREIAS